MAAFVNDPVNSKNTALNANSSCLSNFSQIAPAWLVSSAYSKRPPKTYGKPLWGATVKLVLYHLIGSIQMSSASTNQLLTKRSENSCKRHLGIVNELLIGKVSGRMMQCQPKNIMFHIEAFSYRLENKCLIECMWWIIISLQLA